MNDLGKLEEATMKSLQEKFDESESIGVEASGIEVVSGSSDQYMFIEPTLLKKDDHYIWVAVNWEKLHDLADNLFDENTKSITIDAEFLLDDDGNPIQEDEQYDFIDREITSEDLEYFKGEEDNIKSVLIEYTKWIWDNIIGEGKFPEDVEIDIAFKMPNKLNEDNEKKYISERGEEAREFFNTIDFKPFFDEIRKRIGDSSIQFEEPTMGDFNWDSFRVGFVSEDLSKKCGVMSCVYEYCQIDGNGGGIAQSDEEEIYLWLPAHFSFQYTDGGSNGHTLMRGVYTKNKGWEFSDVN